MIANPPTMTIPLRTDEGGIIRIGATRVTLDVLIARYQQGESPEAIYAGFPTIPLTDVYAVIAYYLAHQAEVDAYMQRNETEAEQLRQEWEAAYPPLTRAELRARMETKRKSSGSV